MKALCQDLPLKKKNLPLFKKFSRYAPLIKHKKKTKFSSITTTDT